MTTGILVVALFMAQTGAPPIGSQDQKTSGLVPLQGVWANVELDKIEYFGPVTLDSDGALTTLGLANSDFEDYARERFRAHVKGARILAQDEVLEKHRRSMLGKPDDKYGHVAITIRTLPFENLVIYYIKLDVGPGLFVRHSHSSHFGFAARGEFPAVLRASIDSHLEGFALAFHENRKKP